jgi:hypothetical protein
VPPAHSGKYLNLNALAATAAITTPNTTKSGMTGKPPTSHFYLHPQSGATPN